MKSLLKKLSPVQFGLLMAVVCTIGPLCAAFVLNSINPEHAKYGYWSCLGGLIGGFPAGYYIQKRELAHKE